MCHGEIEANFHLGRDGRGEWRWQYKYKNGGGQIVILVPHQDSYIKPTPGKTKFVVKEREVLHVAHSKRIKIVLVDLIRPA